MAGAGMIKNMMVVAAAVTMLMLMTGTAAETFTVGDSSGWRVPQSSDFYSSWASGHTFAVGDNLVFNFATQSHSVFMTTSKDAYDNCDVSLDSKSVAQTTGPATITLTSEGDVFFFCTIGRHCSLGQKLAITVAAGSGNPVAAGGGNPLAPTSSQTPQTQKDAGSAPKPMVLTLTTLALSLMSLAMALGYH